MGYFRVSHAGYHWVNWPNLPFSTHFDHFANHFWYGCFMLLVLANPCIWWLVLFAGGFLFFNTIAKPPAFIWSIRMYIKDVLLVLRLYHLPSECLSQAHQDCWNSSIVFMPDKYYLLFIGGQKSLPGAIYCAISFIKWRYGSGKCFLPSNEQQIIFVGHKHDWTISAILVGLRQALWWEMVQA